MIIRRGHSCTSGSLWTLKLFAKKSCIYISLVSRSKVFCLCFYHILLRISKLAKQTQTTIIQTHQQVMNLCCKPLWYKQHCLLLQIKLYWGLPFHFCIFYGCFHDIAGLSSWDGECMAHKLLSGPFKKKCVSSCPTFLFILFNNPVR